MPGNPGRYPCAAEGDSQFWRQGTRQRRQSLEDIRRLGGRLSAAILSAVLILGATLMAPAAAVAAGLDVAVIYLTKQEKQRLPLSLLDSILEDDGIWGARLGLQDNQTTGRFLKHAYRLTEAVLPEDGDPAAAFRSRAAEGVRLFLADLRAEDLEAIAALPEAAGALIFNVRAPDDALRNEGCRANVFHVVPSRAMRTDALALALLVSPLLGEDAAAQAGLLTGGAEKLDPITLSSGQPLAKAPYQLEAGQYYKLAIVADGSAELAISGADFFRNVRVDEVVINDIEVRPLGVDSLEFDDDFLRDQRIPGTTGESQQAVFNVEKGVRVIFLCDFSGRRDGPLRKMTLTPFSRPLFPPFSLPPFPDPFLLDQPFFRTQLGDGSA